MCFGACTVRYSWWRASVSNRKLQPGINWAAVVVPGVFAAAHVYTQIYLQFPYYADREKIMEQCNGECLFASWPMQTFPLVLVLAMVVSVCWGKKLPRHRRGKIALV